MHITIMYYYYFNLHVMHICLHLYKYYYVYYYHLLLYILLGVQFCFRCFPIDGFSGKWWSK